jgi:mono/diheme cytochrome c family protein
MKILKSILKWTGISILVLLLIFAGYIWSQQNKKWEAPYPDIHASKDSAVIARGEYLFYGPAHCLECHMDISKYESVMNGERATASGGYVFDLPVGVIRAPNLTSDMETGIGKLTDQEIARTLRYGVGSDGRAILDFMPFYNTSDEDLTAIISYIRTMAPVKNEVPRVQWNLLGKIIKVLLLKPVGPDGEPPKKVVPNVSVEYGKYLANSIANCKGCHTDRDLMTGAYIGEDYSGGFKMDVVGKPGLFIVSRNLTPDPETGHIKDWSVEKFTERFRQGKLMPDSPMPWGPFHHFSDDDLKSIYMYLHTVKPVKHDAGPVIVMEK